MITNTPNILRLLCIFILLIFTDFVTVVFNRSSHNQIFLRESISRCSTSFLKLIWECTCKSRSHGDDNFYLKTLPFHLQAIVKEYTAPEEKSHESKAKRESIRNTNNGGTLFLPGADYCNPLTISSNPL